MSHGPPASHGRKGVVVLTRRRGCCGAILLFVPGLLTGRAGNLASGSEPERRNVIFVLSDDHRFDFMRFMPQCPKFLETPNMDRMARAGAHLANAFVSTSLCSPSRASILTGKYMHHHRVVDNQRPVPDGTVFFPQYLQQAGYQTAFIGKWHMGHERDDPRPGFDHWVSFPGQGTYRDPTLNIDGDRRDIHRLHDRHLDRPGARLAVSQERDRTRPFFLYLSFKAVHYPFEPAERHRGRYEKEPIDYPETMANTARNYQTQPRWVRERRYSIHGIDHMETGAFDKDPVPDFDDLYHRYCETVHGLDENLGRVLQYIDREGLAQNTLVLYMGDNGFALGEHGFYDKRDAFEVSIRVPMLAYAPGMIRGGLTIRAIGTEHRRGPYHPGGVRRRSAERCGNGRQVFSAIAPKPIRSMARPHSVRISLGVEFSRHTHDVCHSDRPIQVHLLPRALGPGRSL